MRVRACTWLGSYDAKEGEARRTAKYDVISAWKALLESEQPKDILQHARLQDARAEINAEVERHTHAPPKFSKDGKIAVLRIHSAAQVHPVIATRWVSTLPLLLLDPKSEPRPVSIC